MNDRDIVKITQFSQSADPAERTERTGWMDAVVEPVAVCHDRQADHDLACEQHAFDQLGSADRAPLAFRIAYREGETGSVHGRWQVSVVKLQGRGLDPIKE